LFTSEGPLDHRADFTLMPALHLSGWWGEPVRGSNPSVNGLQGLGSLRENRIAMPTAS
jgi:hypothetical protein